MTNNNFPADFWKLLAYPITKDEWEEAGQGSFGCLAELPVFSKSTNLSEVVNSVLTEEQFGPRHFRFRPSMRLYYSFIRHFLPGSARSMTKRLLKNQLMGTKLLNWPIEDRFVIFQWDLMFNLLKKKGLSSIPYIQFWPNGKRFAFVITHDVEDVYGQEFVREVADLEEKYGFRSGFNFVPEGYPADRRLMRELEERGFEVGVHGLKHDGTLFSSRDTFNQQAVQINEYLKNWGAVGFRAPFTHRNPEWMQALNVEYDASFFDTDPFEPIPGGTMSIWPFMMGNFVELPYTLVQDHTLMITLGEQTPKIWLEKVNFLRRYCGMALFITHPDYLRQANHFSIYESFLKELSRQDDYWHALPKEAARWWRQRNQLTIKDGVMTGTTTIPGVTVGEIRRFGNNIELFKDGKIGSEVEGDNIHQ